MVRSASSPVRLLQWDSQFFRFRVARITKTRLTSDSWESVLSWCRAREVRCLYYEADLSDFQSLSVASKAGFLVVDVRIVLERPITASILQRDVTDPMRDRMVIRSVQPDELSSLEEIAREMGKISRFSFDSHFPRGAAGEMYVIWMHNIYQSADGIVLASLLKDRVTGFIACEKQKGSGKIALVGVHSDFQGEGIGSSLLQAALGWFFEQGCTTAGVRTQGRNVEAQCLYQKAGFRTASVSLIQHYWFEGLA